MAFPYNVALAEHLAKYGVPYEGPQNAPAPVPPPTPTPAVPIASTATQTTPAAPDYSNLVSQAYRNIGVSSPDVSGQQYWTQQLQSGALSPTDFNRTFLQAASGVTNPELAQAAATARNLLNTAPTTTATTTTTTPADSNLLDLVNRAYQSIGVTSPDPEGLSYWTSQLRSGALTPTNFNRAFLQAASGVANPNLSTQVGTAKNLYYNDLINEAYRNIGVTAPDSSGTSYWLSQLQSGALTPSNFFQTFYAAAANAPRTPTPPVITNPIIPTPPITPSTPTVAPTPGTVPSIGAALPSLPTQPTQYITPGGAVSTPPAGVTSYALPMLNMRNLVNAGVVPSYVAAPQTTPQFSFTPITQVGRPIF